MNEHPGIGIEHDQHVTHITLRNPARRNAMCHAMWQQLGDALQAAHEDADLRVLVLTGAGDKAFCAGNDISEFKTWRNDPARHRAYDAASHRAMDLLRSVPVPVIARIRGVCVGGGLEIALACDLRIASDDARFAITPARLGLGYTLRDVSLVVDTVGAAAARKLLYTGRLHDAGEALAMGVLDVCVPPDALDDALADLVRTIAGNAPLTIRALKAALGEALKPGAQRDEARVQAMVDACHASEDYQEGQRAFAEKRAPQFRGR